MSIYRRAAKNDSNHGEVVEALEKAGCQVITIRLPVDILVRHSTWPSNRWALAEIKVPDKSGTVRNRSDRKTQTEFCTANGVPYLVSAESALEWLRAVG